MSRAPTTAEPLAPLGRYHPLRALGAGAMCRVHLAFDPAEGRHVALKVLRPEVAADPQSVERFAREGRVTRRLRHPGVPRVYAGGRDSATGWYYLALEYLEGEDLQTRLDASGPLPTHQAVAAALDAARALSYVHSCGYIHRDIKPGNLLLGRDGRARLLDFGLAKRMGGDPGLTSTQEACGTPYYMPYEQGVNPDLVDGRSDLFALGATLYHLLTGEVPFPGSDHGEVARRKAADAFAPASARLGPLPAALDDLLARLLRRDPRQRFRSADELVAALEALDLARHDRRAAAAPTASHRPAPDALASTRADLAVGVARAEAVEDAPGWTLRVRIDSGEWVTTSASAEQIADWRRLDRLPAGAELSRPGSQRYRPVTAYPEFAAALAEPDPDAPRRRPRWWLVPLSLALGLGILAVGVLLWPCPDLTAVARPGSRTAAQTQPRDARPHRPGYTITLRFAPALPAREDVRVR